MHYNFAVKSSGTLVTSKFNCKIKATYIIATCFTVILSVKRLILQVNETQYFAVKLTGALNAKLNCRLINLFGREFDGQLAIMKWPSVLRLKFFLYKNDAIHCYFNCI